MIKTWWDDFKRISYIDARWLTVWFCIYLGFLTIDIFFPTFFGSSLLKYVGIFLCIVYANAKYHDDTKLILALFFTFLADTLLVWTPWETAGVFVFCFAQIMHFLRLTKLDRKYLLFYAAGALGLIGYTFINGENILYALATLYAIFLLCNLIMSFKRYRANKKDFHARCGWYGFVAFIGCDTCVGIRHLMLDGVISSHILPLVAFLVWVFYYPSQVLLANSSATKETLKRRTVAKNPSLS